MHSSNQPAGLSLSDIIQLFEKNVDLFSLPFTNKVEYDKRFKNDDVMQTLSKGFRQAIASQAIHEVNELLKRQDPDFNPAYVYSSSFKNNLRMTKKNLKKAYRLALEEISKKKCARSLDTFFAQNQIIFKFVSDNYKLLAVSADKWQSSLENKEEKTTELQDAMKSSITVFKPVSTSQIDVNKYLNSLERYFNFAGLNSNHKQMITQKLKSNLLLLEVFAIYIDAINSEDFPISPSFKKEIMNFFLDMIKCLKEDGPFKTLSDIHQKHFKNGSGEISPAKADKLNEILNALYTLENSSPTVRS